MADESIFREASKNSLQLSVLSKELRKVFQVERHKSSEGKRRCDYEGTEYKK